MGQEWLKKFKLDREIIDILHIDHLQVDTSFSPISELQKILDEYNQIERDEIGVIPNYTRTYSYRLRDENGKPIFIKPRQVPYALQFCCTHQNYYTIITYQ